MVYSSIISLAVVIYFIYDQFEFSRVTKIRFLFLPLFCLYQFISKLDADNVNDLLSAVLIFVIATVIGFYQSFGFQSKFMRIKSDYFFIDQQGREVNAYRKVLYAKGGKKYLIGWILIFLITLFLNGEFNGDLGIDKLLHALVEEILEDLLFFVRIGKINHDWKVWELLGVANAAYLAFVRFRSIDMRSFFAKKKVEAG